MDLIIKKRAHGKTCDLVLASARTGIPIVCFQTWVIEDRAKELGVTIPKPIAYKDFIARNVSPDSVYIDELEMFLLYAFSSRVECATISLDNE